MILYLLDSMREQSDIDIKQKGCFLVHPFWQVYRA